MVAQRCLEMLRPKTGVKMSGFYCQKKLEPVTRCGEGSEIDVVEEQCILPVLQPIVSRNLLLEVDDGREKQQK